MKFSANIDEYITATKNIIGHKWDTEPHHIYLATEDTLVIKYVQSNMLPNWTIYISRTTFKDAWNTRPFSVAAGNEVQDGLESLTALLMSLEVNKYVLTTESNWSWLIKKLRKYVVVWRYGGYTEMFDVRPGELWIMINDTVLLCNCIYITKFVFISCPAPILSWSSIYTLICNKSTFVQASIVFLHIARILLMVIE